MFREDCPRTKALASIGGQKSRRHKLTAEQVCEARRLRAEGCTYAVLGERYGVSRRGIREAMEMTHRQYPATIGSRLAARQDDKP